MEELEYLAGRFVHSAVISVATFVACITYVRWITHLTMKWAIGDGVLLAAVNVVLIVVIGVIERRKITRG